MPPRPALCFVLTVLVCSGVHFSNSSASDGDQQRLAFTRTDLQVEGLGPRGILAEDLNGDEIPDLVVANLGTYQVYESQTLNVFFGRGDGTFTLAQSLPAGDGNEPYGIAAADLRGIGRLDIVVPNKAGHTVSVYLSRDDGTFEEPKTYETGDAWSVSAGDVDGDGVPDLAVGNFDLQTLSILPGVGDGQFHLAETITTVGLRPRAVELGDLNGDGLSDLVVPSDTLDGRLAIFINKSKPGNVSLSEPQIIRVGSGTGAAVIHDLNNDGNLDVVASSIASDHVSVLMGNGDGTVAPPRNYWTGDVWPFLIALADLDNDGAPDIVASGAKGARVSVLLGDGRGGFGVPNEVWVEGPSRWLVTSDFDSNGQIDVAVGNYTLTGGFETNPALFFNTVSILLNRPWIKKTGPYAVRINCGGPEYANSRGIAFAADSGFEGGQVVTTTATIDRTADQELYRSAREGRFSYITRVAPGRSYTVRLHFAETVVKRPRKRQFNVTLNGQRVRTRLDILGHAPRNTAKAINLYRVWPDLDGKIQIDFTPVRRGALCSAISIF